MSPSESDHTPTDDDAQTQEIKMDAETLTRLKTAIESKTKNLSEFSRLSKMAPASLRDYFRGARKPGFDAIITILKHTGVSAEWLLLGRGPMHHAVGLEHAEDSLIGQIAQTLELACLGDGLSVNEASSGYYASTNHQHLEQVAQRTVIAATIYRKVASITDPQKRTLAIKEEALRYANLLKKLEITKLNTALGRPADQDNQ